MWSWERPWYKKFDREVRKKKESHKHYTGHIGKDQSSVVVWNVPSSLEKKLQK